MTTLPDTTRAPIAPVWRESLAMAVLVGLLNGAALAFTRGPGELSALWLGNGVLAGWLLARPYLGWLRALLAPMLVDLAARLALMGLPLLAAALTLADLLEIVLVVQLVRRYAPDVGNPERWTQLGAVATVATLVACLLSALLAAAANAASGGTEFVVGYVTWFAAHVLGMVVFATATLVVLYDRRAMAMPKLRTGPFLGMTLIVAAVTLVVFSIEYPVLYLAYPPLLWLALRFGFAGVAAGVLVLGLVGGLATTLGQGPLTLDDGLGRAGRIALLQLYIAGACVLTIPAVLVMAERRRLVQRLRESEQRYRLLADYSHDLIVRMRPDGTRVYVSPAARDVLGWEPEQMLGPCQDQLHPDDREAQLQTLERALASGQAQIGRYRLRHRNGQYVWIEGVVRPIPAFDGHEAELICTGRDISQRVATEQALAASLRELEQQAREDPLTGLANRRQFEERLGLALSRLRRYGRPLALFFLDLDDFKPVNDTHGHAAGDHVLVEFAARLQAQVRETDLVARLGGDEFAILVEDAEIPAGVLSLAGKLLALARTPVALGGSAVRVGASIGIACAEMPVSAADLQAAADAALYEAKDTGGGTWRMRRLTDPRAARMAPPAAAGAGDAAAAGAPVRADLPPGAG
ncbi:sensor domain-containing diguanylate cyclase [Thermomonas flagellata]|uniref:sensor domain-containing diguanylate cyclase n=1 Tax=Thermomonas flagellata TaxID=2888524 RepID=UPI001F034E1F|nr:sensor domain-containing diguanylate cyclase [Thermomonas flagellata]